MNTETLMTVFGGIGISVVCGGVLIMAYCAFDSLRDVVRGLFWHYKYKHRFDKPPTAACYCKDCKYHVEKDSNGAGPCEWPGVSRWTPDNGFCYEADPKVRDDNAAD